MPTNMSVEYPKLEAENQKLKRLLHDLTPGGSEFYNDPEYCAKWIKENRQNESNHLKEMIKKLRGKNGELLQYNKVLREALGDLLEDVRGHYEAAEEGTDNPIFQKAKAALEQTK